MPDCKAFFFQLLYDLLFGVGSEFLFFIAPHDHQGSAALPSVILGQGMVHDDIGGEEYAAFKVLLCEFIRDTVSEGQNIFFTAVCLKRIFEA